MYETKGIVQSTSPEKHALHLLDLFEDKEATLKEYIDDCDNYFVRISIWWKSEIGHGAFDLSSSVVSRLSKLCQYISHTYIYAGDCDEEDNDEE